MDVRRWGPGERIVFEPYTKETFDETFKWIDERGIFENGLGARSYEGALRLWRGNHAIPTYQAIRGS